MENSPSLPRVISANPTIGERGNLHLYLPEEKGLHPFVFAIHGGSWRNGDQTSYHYLWPKLKPLGLALVLASYRMSVVAPFPAAYDDLVHSLGWLKENGESQGLDVSRCALMGASAGGHLAMLLASRATAENVPRPHIRAVAQYCGIMDLTAQFAWDEKRGASMTHDFLRTRPTENPELYRQASPIEHLHPAMPPVWMAHGSADPIVSVEQSHRLVERLHGLNHDVIFHEARGLGHTLKEMTIEGQATEPMELLFEKDLLRFLQRTLQPHH